MPQISINREDAMKILNNPDAGSDARVIAGLTVAFFEADDHAEEIAASTRQITLKLAHMTADAIYKGAE